MKNIVILDIETTGADYLLDEICQMSYIVVDRNFNVMKAKNYFFMVEYVHFKSNKNKLNIDKLRSLSNNKTFKDRYDEIFNDLNNNLIVCHKCEHDISFLKSEFMRVDNKNKFVYEEFCTMKYYTNILKLPSEIFGYKYPKLIEIMPYLNIKRGDIHNKSKEIFDLSDNEITFHDSRVDAVATYLVAAKTDQLIHEYEIYINKDQYELYQQKEENIKITIHEDKAPYTKLNIEENGEIFLEESLPKKNEDNIVNDNTKIDKKKISLIIELFSFKGNLNRKKYSGYLLMVICMFILSIIVSSSIYINSDMSEHAIKIIEKIIDYTLIYFIISLSAKRLRNLKKSMWLNLLLLIPFINIFFIIYLCISKDSKKIIDCQKIKILNPTIILIGSLIMPAIILLSLYIFFNSDSANENEAIGIVKNTVSYVDLELDEEVTIDSHINQKVEEINPYYIDGWYAYKIEDSIYLVCFDFDREDDDYENGYSSYPFEVNIETKEILEISSDKMIEKYENLGHFDDETYINEFKLEKSM